MLSILSSSLFLSAYVFTSSKGVISKPESIRVAVRSIGHQLLLADANKTSRVLPVQKPEEDWSKISFDAPLSITPDSLVEIVNRVLFAADIPLNYWMEVKLSKSDEVAYSYLMDSDTSASMIPCLGRLLPNDAYTVSIKLNTGKSQASLLFPGAAVLSLLMFGLLLYRRKEETLGAQNQSLVLGSYHLKKDERKLIYKNENMSLTEKEVELLVLFSGRPNQTISREELQREVWESKGVIVGRSLDTYVSKLRRKFDKDSSVAIRNVHGSGYKLEVRK